MIIWGFRRMGGLAVEVPHVMCVDCFRVFVESRVSDRKLVTSREFDGYTVGCPMGCADSFIDPACFEVGGVATRFVCSVVPALCAVENVWFAPRRGRSGTQGSTPRCTP